MNLADKNSDFKYNNNQFELIFFIELGIIVLPSFSGKTCWGGLYTRHSYPRYSAGQPRRPDAAMDGR